MEKNETWATWAESVVKDTDTEIFVQIKNWPYEVSNRGRVWSQASQKYLSTKSNTIILQENGRKMCYSVSLLVAEAFLPNPNNFLIVEHIDANETNNDVRNLRWVNRQTKNCPEMIDKYRNTYVKKYGYITAISPKGKRYQFRSQREAMEQTGVPRNTIQYAIAHGTRPQGWTFTR